MPITSKIQNNKGKLSDDSYQSSVIANYQQRPIDDEGRLYKHFKTYEHIPNIEKVVCRVDTADEGEDFLCSIIFACCNNMAYVLDIIYTDEPTEVTEPKVASRIKSFEVNHALVESNNGGKAYCRAVEKIYRSIGGRRAVFDWFHESRKKEARILANASWVMENILYPVDWMYRWPEYFEAMSTYQRQGKNIHDDAPDCTTGVAEHFFDNDISRAKFKGTGFIK